MNHSASICVFKVRSTIDSIFDRLKKNFRALITKIKYFHEYKGALSNSLPKWYRKLIAGSIFHRAWVSGRFYWVRSNGALSLNSFKSS
jgi:hypothetical protein